MSHREVGGHDDRLPESRFSLGSIPLLGQSDAQVYVDLRQVRIFHDRALERL